MNDSFEYDEVKRFAKTSRLDDVNPIRYFFLRGVEQGYQVDGFPLNTSTKGRQWSKEFLLRLAPARGEVYT